MSIFGNKEKEENSSEEKFTFPLASEDTINQSTLAKDIQIHGSIEAKDYIKTNISLIEKLGLNNIKKSNTKLTNLLKENNIEIVESNNEVWKFIDVLINEDDVSKIDTIHESFKNLRDHL